MCLKFRNPKFNLFCKITILSLYTKCQIRSGVHNAILEKVKVKVGLIICFNFLRNKSYIIKISSKNSIYKFPIKIHLKSFVFKYHFIIYWEFTEFSSIIANNH